MEDNVYPGLAEALAEHLKRKIVTPKAEPSSGANQGPEDPRSNGAYDPETMPVSR